VSSGVVAGQSEPTPTEGALDPIASGDSVDKPDGAPDAMPIASHDQRPERHTSAPTPATTSDSSGPMAATTVAVVDITPIPDRAPTPVQTVPVTEPPPPAEAATANAPFDLAIAAGAVDAAFATTAGVEGVTGFPGVVRFPRLITATSNVAPLAPLANEAWAAEVPVDAAGRAAASAHSPNHVARNVRDARHSRDPQAPTPPFDAGSTIAGGVAPSGGSTGTGMAAIVACLLLLALVGIARRVRDADVRPRSTYRLLVAERPG
jgi:hypothetical protein